MTDIKEVLERIKKSQQSKKQPVVKPVDEDEELEQEEEMEEQEIETKEKTKDELYEDELKHLKEEIIKNAPPKKEFGGKKPVVPPIQPKQPVQEVEQSIEQEVQLMFNEGIFRRELLVKLMEINQNLKDLNTLIASFVQ